MRLENGFGVGVFFFFWKVAQGTSTLIEACVLFDAGFVFWMERSVLALVVDTTVLVSSFYIYYKNFLFAYV